MILIDYESLWEIFFGGLTKSYGRAIIERLRSQDFIRILKDFGGFIRILNDSEELIVIIREYKGKKREYKVKTIKKPRIISSTNCSFKTLKVN